MLDTWVVLVQSASQRPPDQPEAAASESIVVEIPRMPTGETPHIDSAHADGTVLGQYEDRAFEFAILFERASEATAERSSNGGAASTESRAWILRELDRIARRTLVVPVDGPIWHVTTERASAPPRVPDRLEGLESQLADLRDEISDLHQRNQQLQSQAWRTETDLMTLQQINLELENALDGGSTSRTRTVPRASSITYGSPLNAPSRNHALEEAFQEVSRHARALQQHIDNIESSRGWRVFSVYRRIKDSLIGRVRSRPARQP